MQALDKQMNISGGKILIDIVGVIFWSFGVVAFCVAVLMDNTVPKMSLIIGLIPVFFTYLATRGLMRHLRAKAIIIRERGVEISKQKERLFLEWKTIEKLSEKRGFSGGLSLHSQTGSTVFIPFVVQHYDEVRDYIILKTGIKMNSTRQPKHPGCQ